MQSETNERFIKLAGRIPVSQAFDLGSEVKITIGSEKVIASCVKVETHDNQDGTVDEVYVLKYLA